MRFCSESFTVRSLQAERKCTLKINGRVQKTKVKSVDMERPVPTSVFTEKIPSYDTGCCKSISLISP